MNVLYIFGSVVVVSLISVIFAIPFLLKKKISNKVLLVLLSMSVGVLLTTVFMDFLPEAFTHDYNLWVVFYIILGFLLMFVLEKLIHYHHNKKCEQISHAHSHAYAVAPLNIIGDGVHNFIDGLVIAGSYAVNTTVGIAATISIIFHEIPQEIADFGVLLYSGMSKKKALIFNFLSAATAIVGAGVGILLLDKIHGFSEFVIPFAAGNFIYIAASNLVPQLHRECKFKDTILHVVSILAGVGIITLITIYGPAHGH